jgi:TMEM151 family
MNNHFDRLGPLTVMITLLLLILACLDVALASLSESQSSAPLGLRAIASVMGESAVVDNESGRILWEGGSSSTLAESIAPKLQSLLGIPHLKATILSTILWWAAIAGVSRAISNQLSSIFGTVTRPYIQTIILSFTRTLLRLPQLPIWLVATTAMLYVAEALSCSTHRYLWHTVDNAEAYIDRLRKELPKLEWKVRSYHYEHSLASLVNMWLAKLRTKAVAWDSVPQSVLPHDTTSTHLRWKRVTRTARAYYHYASCRDRTIVGVWRRAPPSAISRLSRRPRHFTKMSLIKTILLRDATARLDYIHQQRSFLKHQHSDDFAEFSTRIHIAGYQPRLLASTSGRRPVWCTPVVFWIFTLLGLTVPYRRFLSSRCDEVRVRVVKETGKDDAVSTGWFAPKQAETLPLPPDTLSFRSIIQLLYEKMGLENPV